MQSNCTTSLGLQAKIAKNKQAYDEKIVQAKFGKKKKKHL